jgi:hypothetical protein
VAILLSGFVRKGFSRYCTHWNYRTSQSMDRSGSLPTLQPLSVLILKVTASTSKHYTCKLCKIYIHINLTLQKNRCQINMNLVFHISEDGSEIMQNPLCSLFNSLMLFIPTAFNSLALHCIIMCFPQVLF